MCKVISVVNQKGGVGKTTTTVNVGIGLAREGKKVLLIDADPQGSLTASLGYEEPDDLRITLATIMMDVINEEEISLEDGILHHQENVDLLPANIELSALEVTMGNVMSREMIMKEYIDAIRSRYDYILIDCMPSLGMMTINALVSSDSVLIPVQAAYLPVKGLQQLIKTILTVKKRLNRKLAIEGILLTMVDFRTNYARDIASRVHTTYGSQIEVFENVIPMSVKAAETSAEGKSIYMHCPKGKVAEAYKNLTQEVLKNENRSGEKIKLASIDELLGVVNEESAMEIEISKIHPFKNHPFKVLDDEKMQDLVESVGINGVLTPVLLRMDDNEEYEMVSGHRRMHAAQLAGLTTIPAIVRELSDDDAIVAMVDANIQREELLPSEKAFAYKMKLEAMKRQGVRTDLTLSQNETKLRSDEVLSKQVGESRAQVQRFVRLTELIPELLDLVDNKKLQFTVAVNISYIDKEVQGWIYEYISDTGFIKPKQIAALRNQLNDGPINQIQMLSIFNNCVMAKKVSRSLTFSEKKLTKYFPDDYTAKDMEQVIESLLEKWMQEQSC